MICGRVLKLENCFAAIILKIESGNNYQWMLNLEEIFYEEQDICIFKVFPHRIAYYLQGRTVK